MILSTQLDLVDHKIGVEEAIRLFANAGFDAVDLSMFEMSKPDSLMSSEQGEAHVLHLGEVAKECGIVFNQAHAPFVFSDWAEPGRFENVIFPTVVRAVKMAASIGVKNIVVHPIQYLPYRYNAEKLYEMNLDYYKRLIPYCEEYGIRIATENMWQTDPKRKHIVSSICADPLEFSRLLDDLNSPWIVGCLDLGHCALTGYEPQDVIRIMGAKHIHCLHVHDVDYISDLHTVPYLGKLEWDAITAAFGEIGYRGDFTFEANNFFRNTDPALLPAAARYMHDVGRLLISKIEAAYQ